ncbi:hypothetical protein SAMN05216388_1008153 [Halorientalis persicus]|uniref:Uncharacterized protein n=1 Tax=Halorientalis persicus TaxID=1367881 RepID=A0A1H8M8V9_9EURY|nr:hypothetical protein SAMN05216388_1008153 [Halorientalis persicus]
MTTALSVSLPVAFLCWTVSLAIVADPIHWFVMESIRPSSPGWVVAPFTTTGLFKLVLTVPVVAVFGGGLERYAGSRHTAVFVLGAAYVPLLAQITFAEQAGSARGVVGSAAIALALGTCGSLLYFWGDTDRFSIRVDTDAVIGVVLALCLLVPLAAAAGLLPGSRYPAVGLLTGTAVGLGGFLAMRFEL